MKKNLSKIFAASGIVVAIILIVILIITAFGGISTEDFNNKVLKGLLVTLGVLYLALSVITLALLFSNTNNVKEVVVRQGRKGSLRISAKTIEKTVKEITNNINEGVKCKKVVLLTDDYGTRLKVSLKVVDMEPFEIETAARVRIEDRFINQFGLAFSSIEIKIVQFKAKYEADEAAIKEKIEQQIAEQKEHFAEEEALASAEEESVRRSLAEVAENAEEVNTAVDDAVDHTASEGEAEEHESDVAVEDEAKNVEAEEAEEHVAHSAEEVESEEAEEAEVDSDKVNE